MRRGIVCSVLFRASFLQALNPYPVFTGCRSFCCSNCVLRVPQHKQMQAQVQTDHVELQSKRAECERLTAELAAAITAAAAAAQSDSAAPTNAAAPAPSDDAEAASAPLNESVDGSAASSSASASDADAAAAAAKIARLTEAVGKYRGAVAKLLGALQNGLQPAP